MPRLPDAPDRGAGYCPEAEDHADPRTRTLHALQRLLADAALSVQAQPSGRAACRQDYGERSAVDMVAGGEMKTRVPRFGPLDRHPWDSAPPKPKFHHVFISYSRQEEEFQQVREFIELVVDELKRRGLNRDVAEFIWLDMLELYYDGKEEALETALREGIDTSGKFLAFVSPKYAHSKWCQFEHDYAQRCMPMLNVVWKGPSPIDQWWSAWPPKLDARPFFSPQRLTAPSGPRWMTAQDEESWQDKALRGIKDRLYEYMLFRSFVDLIHNFIVEDDLFEISPEASLLWEDTYP